MSVLEPNTNIKIDEPIESDILAYHNISLPESFEEIRDHIDNLAENLDQHEQQHDKEDGHLRLQFAAIDEKCDGLLHLYQRIDTRLGAVERLLKNHPLF